MYLHYVAGLEAILQLSNCDYQQRVPMAAASVLTSSTSHPVLSEWSSNAPCDMLPDYIVLDWVSKHDRILPVHEYLELARGGTQFMPAAGEASVRAIDTLRPSWEWQLTRLHLLPVVFNYSVQNPVNSLLSAMARLHELPLEHLNIVRHQRNIIRRFVDCVADAVVTKEKSIDTAELLWPCPSAMMHHGLKAHAE